MQAKKLAQGFLVLSTVVVLSACGSTAGSSTLTVTPTVDVSTPVAPATANMPNPASVFCTQHGGRVDLRNSNAGVYGVCIFTDKSECDEWAFYRVPASRASSPTAPTPQASN